MPWFRLKPELDGRDLVDVQTLFLVAYGVVAARRGGSDMAMLVSQRIELPSRSYYFTPATGSLAPEFIRAIRAQDCEPPSEPLSFLAGDGSVRTDLIHRY